MPEYAYFASINNFGYSKPGVLRIEQVEIVKVTMMRVTVKHGCWGSHHLTHLNHKDWHKTPALAAAALRAEIAGEISETAAKMSKLECELALADGPLPAAVLVAKA